VTKLQVGRLLIFLIAASTLAACNKSKTSIPLSWRNPAVEQTVFKKLLVIGIGENDGARRLFEDTFAEALAQQGTSAQASWGLLPQSTRLTEGQIRGAVEGGGFDGVLISRLLGVDQNEASTSRATSRPTRRSEWKPTSIPSPAVTSSGRANPRPSTLTPSPKSSTR
jgi:hypothetical protein